MRTIFAVLVLSLSLINLSAQIDCESYYPPLTSIGVNTTETGHSLIYNPIKKEGPKYISLFSQIDFTKNNGLSLLYETTNKEGHKICYTSQIDFLKNLADKYQDAEIITDSNCAHPYNNHLLIIEDKTLTHSSVSYTHLTLPTICSV